MKTGDKIVVAISALLILLSCIFIFLPARDGKTVVIKQNNKVVYEGSLSTAKTVKTATNTVKIENGEVLMEHSSCKNQICVHHSKISGEGEIIVCLPNKMTVEIK